MNTSEQIYDTYLKYNTYKFYNPYYKDTVIDILSYLLYRINFTSNDLYVWTHDLSDMCIIQDESIHRYMLPLCMSINRHIHDIPSNIKNMFYQLKSYFVACCHNHCHIDNVNNFEWYYEDETNGNEYVCHLFNKIYLFYTPLKDLKHIYKGSARINSLKKKVVPSHITENLVYISDNVDNDKIINDILRFYIYCICLGYTVMEKDVKKIKKYFE